MSKAVEFKPWRVGLVGCGTSLTLYEGIHSPGQAFQLIAVTDPDPYRLESAVKKWGELHCYPTSREMFEKEKLQLVLIATPPEHHLASILEAVKFGAHILIQKPLARTVREADQIIEACRDHKLALKTSFYRRYTPAFQAARQLVDSLGEGLALRARWCSSSGLKIRKDKVWKDSIRTLGGVLVDLGSHVVDIARWWMGEVADGHLAISIVRGETDNISSFLLKHDRGGSTLGYISNVEYNGSEIYEYVATCGGFTLERETEGYPGSWTLRSWRIGESSQRIESFENPERNPFLTEVTDLVLALEQGEISVDAGDLGRRALQITTLLYRSASNKKGSDLEDFSLEDFFRDSREVDILRP